MTKALHCVLLGRKPRTHLAHEGDHMMLAQREYLDVFHDNQLVMVFVENGTIDQVAHILLIAFSEVKHGLRISFGCFAKTLSFRVLPDTLQNSPHSSR